VPFWWDCVPSAYGDGVCDCGCSVPDIDCADGDIETCETCNTTGSCNGASCPGRIDPDDTAHCTFLPAEWRCSARAYADETSCDCGCGTPDPDCANDTARSCDTCDLVGSCARGSCPSSIDPEDNALCAIPRGWQCTYWEYGDDLCDCGCGVTDIDCASSSVEDCDECWGGCSSSSCPGTIAPDRNASCTDTPPEWRCNPRFYNDGSICHCGCGALDLDCASDEVASCERCNVEGSCSGQECPGLIDPNFNRECIRPDPPPGWTCPEESYGDGYLCDCGCGVIDADCRENALSACEACGSCGSCPARVDPTDISKCAPAPPQWRCADETYADYTCDCGCGMPDPDCPDELRDYCSRCPTGSCSRSDCRDIDPDENSVCDGGVPSGWTCPADVYDDDACDCGCGALDPDCANASRTACEFCNAPGSCSSATCPGTISASDNTKCG
jgi:hypothetical protein